MKYTNWNTIARKFAHPFSHWYFYCKNQFVCPKKNFGGYMTYDLTFKDDFTFYLMQIASFDTWHLFSLRFFVIVLLLNDYCIVYVIIAQVFTLKTSILFLNRDTYNSFPLCLVIEDVILLRKRSHHRWGMKVCTPCRS